MTDPAATAEGVVLDGVTLARGGRAILTGVTAVIRPGRVTAVTGPSGSGKSTLLAVVAGFEPPDAGTVSNPFPPARRGVVLQSYGLVPLLTAAENVELALQPTGIPPSEVRERAAAELERFGLTPLADRQTDELSSGQQQRLAIARALAIRPDLLIADELTSELDPRNRDLVLSTVFGLRDAGATVVLATHDPRVAEACDAVVALASAPEPGAEAGARDDAAAVAEREQRRRIRAQQELVRREQARLEEMQQALERLLGERGTPRA